MWAKVDDHLDEHKKVFIAGERLGGSNATGRVLAVWLEGRLWTNRNNTLGFIPMNIVRRFQHDEDPLGVAGALSAPLTDDERERWNTSSENCLWVAVAGGYRFHDDEKYRPKKSAEELYETKAEAGRRGGLASAAKRKQTEQPPKQPASALAQAAASNLLAKSAGNSLKTESPPEAELKQPTKPVSRIPVPGTDLPDDRHTPRARSGTLITPPAQQRNTWFFSEIGLHVPNFLHNDEFRPRLVNGGLSEQQADEQLLTWYQQTEQKFRGQRIGDRPVDFWRARFAEWLGTTQTQLSTAAPPERPHVNGDAWREACPHTDDPCGSWAECNTRKHRARVVSS